MSLGSLIHMQSLRICTCFAIVALRDQWMHAVSYAVESSWQLICDSDRPSYRQPNHVGGRGQMWVRAQTGDRLKHWVLVSGL